MYNSLMVTALENKKVFHMKILHMKLDPSRAIAFTNVLFSITVDRYATKEFHSCP